MHAQDLLEQARSTSGIPDDVQRLVRLRLAGMGQRAKDFAGEEFDGLIGGFLVVARREASAFLLIVQVRLFRRRPCLVIFSKSIVMLGQLKTQIDLPIIQDRLVEAAFESAQIRVGLFAQGGSLLSKRKKREQSL